MLNLKCNRCFFSSYLHECIFNWIASSVFLFFPCCLSYAVLVFDCFVLHAAKGYCECVCVCVMCVHFTRIKIHLTSSHGMNENVWTQTFIAHCFYSCPPFLNFSLITVFSIKCYMSVLCVYQWVKEGAMVSGPFFHTTILRVA